MIKSVLRNDTGYELQAHWYKVYLDGVELDRCHTADEELGEAHVYTGKDDEGKLLSKILYAKVEIEKAEIDS